MDRLPKAQLCWLDAAAITNFEASTLPLLYAPEEDCKHYFQAMKRKNPRKGLVLESIYALCLEARAAKHAGRYLDAVRKLREGALKRLEVFHALDYQTVAAFEHCAWAAIHLAVLDLASPGSSTSNSSASSLYQFAVDLLREMKNPETHVEITPFVRTLLEFLVHYNWTSYYVHRSKWHAALQQATLAEARWRKLASTSSEATKNVANFVTVRRIIVQERVDPEHSDTLFEELSEMLGAIGPFENSGHDLTDPTSDSAVSEPETRADNVESTPSCLTVLVAKEGEEREITLCIGASKTRYAWSGSLEEGTKFLAHFTLCMIDHSSGKYRRCLQTIQQQRLYSLIASNPTWSDAATLLMQLCATKMEFVANMGENVQPMPKGMTRSFEGLSVQRVLKKYITSERDRKQRLRLESEKKKQVLDDGVDDDEDPAVTEAKWRIPPTKSEVDGLLLEEGKLNPAVAAFTAMIPVMKKALPTQQALKALEASAIRITSPMVAVREALATRQTISPPRRQAFTPDPVSKLAPVPAELRATSSQSHHERNLSIPKRRPTSPNAAISQIENVYSDSNRKTRLVEKSIAATAPAVGTTVTPNTVNQAEDRAIILDDALREFTVQESEKVIEVIQKYHRENRLEEKTESFVDTLRKLTEASKATSEQYRRLNDRVPSLIAMYDAESEALTRTKATANVKPVSPPKRRQSPVARVHPDRSISPTIIPPPSASPAKMQPPPSLPSESLIENHTDIHDKQRQLRAMLPSIDHHSKAYRLVVKELADNEKILQHQRDLETLSQLTKSAEAGMARRATRSGSVQSGLMSFNGSFAGGALSFKEGGGESSEDSNHVLSAVTAATFLSVLAFGSMSNPAPSVMMAE